MNNEDLSVCKINIDAYFNKKDSRLIKLDLNLSQSDFTKAFEDMGVDENKPTVNCKSFYLNFTFNSVDDYKFDLPSDVTSNILDYSETNSETSSEVDINSSADETENNNNDNNNENTEATMDPDEPIDASFGVAR